MWTQFGGGLRLHPNLFVFLVGPPGTGKCLAPEERVIMYDGSIRRNDTLIPGDLLLGPDGTPRTVLAISRGHGPMFRVHPTKGRPWKCNGDHILSLRKSRNPGAGEICHVSVYEWLTWNDWQKSNWKLWRSNEVKFSPKDDPPVDPYFLGLWLGDGNSYDTGVVITTEDIEVIAYLHKVADEWGLEVSHRHSAERTSVYAIKGQMGRANPLMDALRSMSLYTRGGDRSVPQEYLQGSVQTRELLLAGLIDSDGSYDTRGNVYDFISKSQQMAEDVAFLARSLGFAAYITECTKTCTNNGVSGQYHRVCISGEICDIPCRIERKKARGRMASKNVLNTGFAIEPLSSGDYFGIVLDGDHQFLLEDFTVTHNTVALNPMEAILRKANAVTLAPNDITKQGLLDCLAGAKKGALLGGRPFDYHFLALHVAELTNFMSQYDAALAGLLTDLFDCRVSNDEHKRGHDKGKLIEFPGISMVVGTAPQGLGQAISTEMWGSGFMARVIMVYSAQEVIPEDMFADDIDYTEQDKEIVLGLKRIGEMKGPMIWEPAPYAMLNIFRKDQTNGAPLHNRLANYVRRRTLHLAKLTMIAALNDERMTVEADDFDLAFSWLTEAEADMTEIFKDMTAHEDGELHEEMRSVMCAEAMQSRKPISYQRMVQWLSKRTATHNISRIIEIAEAAGYFHRVGGTTGNDAEYIPQAPDGRFINSGIL